MLGWCTEPLRVRSRWSPCCEKIQPYQWVLDKPKFWLRCLLLNRPEYSHECAWRSCLRLRGMLALQGVIFNEMRSKTKCIPKAITSGDPSDFPTTGPVSTTAVAQMDMRPQTARSSSERQPQHVCPSVTGISLCGGLVSARIIQCTRWVSISPKQQCSMLTFHCCDIVKQSTCA
jgi:hypothetical protein